MTINTNNSNIIKNMCNFIDINNNSKKIKHCNYNNNSNSINYSYKNLQNNNIHTLLKNSSSIALSPLYMNRRHKSNLNNLSLNKAKSIIINYDRIKSTSNKVRNQKKIFNSRFNYKSGNKKLLNYNHHNFKTPKNKISNNISKYNKKEKSHDSKEINSPIYRDNIPVINKYNSFLKMKKIKEIQKNECHKVINLKFKHFSNLSNKNNSKNSKNKSKSKGKK